MNPEGTPLNEDPAYSKFFRMHGMGLPRERIEEKMREEGCDPAALDMDRFAPSPGANPPTHLLDRVFR